MLWKIFQPTRAPDLAAARLGMPVCMKAHIKDLQSPFSHSQGCCGSLKKMGSILSQRMRVATQSWDLRSHLTCNSGITSGKKREEAPRSNSEKAKAHTIGLSLSFMWKLPQNAMELLCCAPQHSRFQPLKPKGCHTDSSLKQWFSESKMGRKGWSNEDVALFPFLS